MVFITLPFVWFSDITATVNVTEAFTDIDYAILVGAMPRRQGMERKDLLKANAGIFQEQGKALDKYAKKSVKVWYYFLFIFVTIALLRTIYILLVHSELQLFVFSVIYQNFFEMAEKG